MNDDWIDKNEMNQLISGINPKTPQQQRSHSGPLYNNDLFYDVQPPAQPQPQPQVVQQPQYQAQPQPQPQFQQPIQQQPHLPPPQMVNQQVQYPQPIHQPDYHPSYQQISPFSLDTEETDAETRIAQLEMMLDELRQTQAPPLEEPPAVEPIPEAEEIPAELEVAEEPPAEEFPSNDRIPLSVEIDRYLSLKGRLASLSEILSEYVDMEQMMVVDQNGLSLFETTEVSAVEGKAGRYLQKIRKVYSVDKDNQRNHSSSQLSTTDDKWLLLLPTDGKGIERKYILKCLLPTPLDQPEIYTLIELLNETMRPDNAKS